MRSALRASALTTFLLVAHGLVPVQVTNNMLSLTAATPALPYIAPTAPILGTQQRFPWHGIDLMEDKPVPAVHMGASYVDARVALSNHKSSLMSDKPAFMTAKNSQLFLQPSVSSQGLETPAKVLTAAVGVTKLQYLVLPTRTLHTTNHLATITSKVPQWPSIPFSASKSIATSPRPPWITAISDRQVILESPQVKHGFAVKAVHLKHWFPRNATMSIASVEPSTSFSTPNLSRADRTAEYFGRVSASTEPTVIVRAPSEARILAITVETTLPSTALKALSSADWSSSAKASSTTNTRLPHSKAQVSVVLVQNTIPTRTGGIFVQDTSKPYAPPQIHTQTSRKWIPFIIIGVAIVIGAFIGSMIYYVSGNVRRVFPFVSSLQHGPRGWFRRSSRPTQLNMNLTRSRSFERSTDLENQATATSTRQIPFKGDGNTITTPSALSSTSTMVQTPEPAIVNLLDPTLGSTPMRPRAMTANSIPRPLEMSGAYPSTINSSTSTSPGSEGHLSTSPRPCGDDGPFANRSIHSARSEQSLHVKSLQAARSQNSLRKQQRHAQQLSAMNASLQQNFF